jgi:hypothetical protein
MRVPVRLGVASVTGGADERGISEMSQENALKSL